jgi:hypothetical protein
MSQSRGRRWILIAIVFVVGVNLIGLLGGSFAPTPGGPTSSSYSTGGDGVAAWAELLAREGHEVSGSRELIADANFDRDATVVILDPREFGPEQRASVMRFVESGGRLVAGGLDASWTEGLVPGLDWSPGAVGEATVLASRIETADVSKVATAGPGSFESTGPALPLIGDGDATVVALASIGRGSVVLISDPTFLQNAGLDRSDNATLALGIVHDHSPVVFVESVHGYSATGLNALPVEWKWALAFAALAALVMIAARARRIGPPDELGRDLPPPRAAYVHSVAGILGRTGRPDEALSGLREEALRRARIDDPERADFDRVATQLNLTEGEKRVLATGVRSETDGVLAARALAKMRRRFGGDP